MIAVEEYTGVAVVSLARPPVNALDLPMVEELESTFARLANATPRIGVVLTGAGNTFSAGVDTKAFASYGSRGASSHGARYHAYDGGASFSALPVGCCG